MATVSLWAVTCAEAEKRALREQEGAEVTEATYLPFAKADAKDRAPFVFAVNTLARTIVRPSNMSKAAFDLHNAVRAKFDRVPFNTRHAVELFWQIKDAATANT